MSGILHEPYLEPSALANIRSYKYSAVDNSVIYKHVISHWCDLLVKCFPLWMAPNLITQSGFGFIINNTVTLYYVAPTPPWAYLSFAIGLFLYQTFDNVDGRQARRTGTSSALGHIFDHTIDSLNCVLGGLLQTTSLCVLSPTKSVLLVLATCAAMWFSTWEEYHTGTLYLGYFNGPTEGVLLACLVHLISAYFGPGIWLIKLGNIEQLGWISDFRLQDIVALCAFTSLAFVHIPTCLVNVYEKRRNRTLPYYLTLLQHVPFVTFCILALAWTLDSESLSLTSSRGSICNDIHSRRRLIEFALLVMFSFGKLSPRIILARLTDSPFPWWNLSAFLPLLLGAVYVNSGKIFDDFVPSERTMRLLLRAMIAASGFAFIQWAYILIDRFTHTLSINCFTIKPKPSDTE